MEQGKLLVFEVCLLLVLAAIATCTKLTNLHQFVIGKTICCATPLNVLFGISPIQCVTECMSRQHCTVLSYQRKSLQCRLFDIDSGSSIFEEDDPSFVTTSMKQWSEDLISPCGRQMCSGFTKCVVQADGSPHCVQSESHPIQWTLAYETDDHGKVISGNWENLKSAIKLAPVVRVYVPSWNQTFSIDASNTDVDSVCSQSLFQVAKDTWNTFSMNATRLFYMFCTHGFYHKSQRHLESSSWLNNANEFGTVGMQWFTRHCCKHQESIPIYCNSAEGNQTCGSFPKLLSAVKHGSEIRLFGGGSLVSHFVNLIIFNQDVIGAQTLRRLTSSKRLEFSNISRIFPEKNMYWKCRISSSDGTQSKLEYYQGIQKLKSIVTLTKHVTWFADICWSAVYSGDGQGKPLTGSLNRLRASILAGKRVRFVIADMSAGEPDSLFLESDGNVTAQFLDYITTSDQSHFKHDASLLWLMLSSTGSANIVELYPGSYVKKSSKYHMFSTTWHSDTRPWRKLLTISATGNVSTGSKFELSRSLKSGSMLRLVVTFSNGTIFAFTPNNIEFYQEEVSAQLVRNAGHDLRSESNERVFTDVPYWNFIIVTTEGNLMSSVWVAGENVHISNFSVSVNTAWFVN